jgi:hypothetical protein
MEAGGLHAMPTNNPAVTSDDAGEAYDPTFTGYAKLWFFIDLCYLCLVEEKVIHGLWFTHRASSDTFDMFFVPIIVLLPGLMALAALLAVRRLSKKGEIQPTAAGRVQQIISLLAFAAYLAMQELARTAFR